MSHNVQDVNKKKKSPQQLAYARPSCVIHIGKEHFAAWNNVAEKKRTFYSYSFAQAVKTSKYSIDEFKKAVVHFRNHKTIDEYIELLKLAKLHVDSKAASRGKYHNQACKSKLVAKVMNFAKFGDTRVENDVEQRNQEDPLGSKQEETAAHEITDAKQNKSVPHADTQTRDAVQSKVKDQGGHYYVTNMSPQVING